MIFLLFQADYVKTYEETRLDELVDTKAGIDNTGISLGLISIGKQCAMDAARDRPEMKTVLDKLEELTDISEKSMKAHCEYILFLFTLIPSSLICFLYRESINK